MTKREYLAYIKDKYGDNPSSAISNSKSPVKNPNHKLDPNKKINLTLIR